MITRDEAQAELLEHDQALYEEYRLTMVAHLRSPLPFEEWRYFKDESPDWPTDRGMEWDSGPPDWAVLPKD